MNYFLSSLLSASTLYSALICTAYFVCDRCLEDIMCLNLLSYHYGQQISYMTGQAQTKSKLPWFKLSDYSYWLIIILITKHNVVYRLISKVLYGSILSAYAYVYFELYLSPYIVILQAHVSGVEYSMLTVSNVQPRFSPKYLLRWYRCSLANSSGIICYEELLTVVCSHTGIWCLSHHLDIALLWSAILSYTHRILLYVHITHVSAFVYITNVPFFSGCCLCPDPKCSFRLPWELGHQRQTFVDVITCMYICTTLFSGGTDAGLYGVTHSDHMAKLAANRDDFYKTGKRLKDHSLLKPAREYRNLAKSAVSSGRSDYYLDQITAHKDSPKKFWNKIQELLPGNNSSSIMSIQSSPDEQLCPSTDTPVNKLIL